MADLTNQRVAHEPDVVTATFMFVDIAGFTALTEARGDEDAAKLVADFCDAVKSELPAFGGVQIKAIGDALMLRIADPGQAVLLGLRIVHDVLPSHGAPAVRVGLHHGPAIERDGDYIGAAVNLAARVSAAATGGEARDPVELVAAVRQGPASDGGLVIDPVCRMAVDPNRTAGRLVYENTTYFFCTLTCAGAFAQGPERFIG